MDSYDIFKKLSAGLSFSKRKKSDDEPETGVRKKSKVNANVRGRNPPKPIESFEELAEKYGVSRQVIKNLEECGYSEPTPVQKQAIPVMCSGRQVLACAPTGSGKTAAFLVPIISELKRPEHSGFRALILCPSRELAKQTFRETLRLTSGTGLRAHIVSKVSQSGHKFGPNFSKKFDILISTPHRLIYLMKMENSILSLDSLKWLVVDESDKLFEAGAKGFGDQLAEIHDSCSSQTLKRALFSATHTVEVSRWCKRNLKDSVTLIIGQRNAASCEVEQELVFVGNENGKLVAFRELVQKGLTPPVLVFVQSKERAKELFEELIYDNVNVDAIHADRPQAQRDNVVQAFREGKLWVLICTELMGRGIDFKGVKLVINYDFPSSAVAYVHRIGRTGRAGRPGKAITFFTEDDRENLRSVSRVLRESGCPVPEYMLKLKKPKKDRKREKTAPVKREAISTQPKNRKRKKKPPVLPTVQDD